MSPLSRPFGASLLLLTFLHLGPLQAADWPRFRGPNGDGKSEDTKVPTEWSETSNLKWKLDLPGAGFSSPIVVGKHVLVTCFSGKVGGEDALKRHLLCIDRQTGVVAWTKVVPGAATEVGGSSFARHGFASHTPVSDGQRVYALFGNSGVLAWDMKGNEVWRKPIGEENAARFGSAASPILHKDMLIVTAGSESEAMYAFNKASGELVWKTEAASLSRSYCTPTIVKNGKGEDELLISVPYEVWGLNPLTGKLRWYAETRIDTNSCPSVLTHEGVVFAIGGRSGGRAAIRLGGKGDVTKSNVVWSAQGGSYVPSPVLHKGNLYWVNDSGVASCVDAKTGKEVGRKRIGGRFYASAVLIGNKIYVVSRFDGTYVFEATPELTQLAHNKLGDDSDFSASPAVSDGQLFVRSDKAIYCIQAE
jgi:outer membrane protein assembly factor BamB